MTIIFTRDIEHGCEWCRKRIEDGDNVLYITDQGTRWRCHARCALAWASVKCEEIEDARANIERWQARWSDNAPAWLTEWRQIMRRPWREIAALMTELSENATRFKCHCSPNRINRQCAIAKDC